LVPRYSYRFMRCCVRIMNWKQRHDCQLPRIDGKPHAADSNERENVEQVNRHVAAIKRRSNEPIRIHYPHEQDQRSDCRNPLNSPFSETREQQKKRYEEMKYDQRRSYPLPAMAHPVQVPLNFFRQISGPDDQELAERQIRPQHDEREEKISKIVKAIRK